MKTFLETEKIHINFQTLPAIHAKKWNRKLQPTCLLLRWICHKRVRFSRRTCCRFFPETAISQWVSSQKFNLMWKRPNIRFEGETFAENDKSRFSVLFCTKEKLSSSCIVETLMIKSRRFVFSNGIKLDGQCIKFFAVNTGTGCWVSRYKKEESSWHTRPPSCRNDEDGHHRKLFVQKKETSSNWFNGCVIQKKSSLSTKSQQQSQPLKNSNTKESIMWTFLSPLIDLTINWELVLCYLWSFNLETNLSHGNSQKTLHLNVRIHGLNQSCPGSLLRDLMYIASRSFALNHKKHFLKVT